MNEHYSLHAGTINPATRTGSGMDYYTPGEHSLVILRAYHNGADRAISSHGEFYGTAEQIEQALGTEVVQVKQGHNADKRIAAQVVGYVDTMGKHWGQVPVKTVQFFVYK